MITRHQTKARIIHYAFPLKLEDSQGRVSAKGETLLSKTSRIVFTNESDIFFKFKKSACYIYSVKICPSQILNKTAMMFHLPKVWIIQTTCELLHDWPYQRNNLPNNSFLQRVCKKTEFWLTSRKRAPLVRRRGIRRRWCRWNRRHHRQWAVQLARSSFARPSFRSTRWSPRIHRVEQSPAWYGLPCTSGCIRSASHIVAVGQGRQLE